MPRIINRIVAAINSDEPSTIKMLAAPFMGLAFVMFMPVVGFGLVLYGMVRLTVKCFRDEAPAVESEPARE